jgi:hypothetical protein
LKALLGGQDIELRLHTPLFFRNLEQIKDEETQQKKKPYMSPRTMRRIYGAQRRLSMDYDANDTFELHNKPH